jgi:hypothetical protein
LVVNRISGSFKGGSRERFERSTECIKAREGAGILEMLVRELDELGNHCRIAVNVACAGGGYRRKVAEKRLVESDKNWAMIRGVKFVVMVEASAGDGWEKIRGN